MFYHVYVKHFKISYATGNNNIYYKATQQSHAHPHTNIHTTHTHTHTHMQSHKADTLGMAYEVSLKASIGPSVGTSYSVLNK